MNNLLKQLCDELSNVVEENAKMITVKEMEEIMRKASQAEDIRYAFQAIKSRN